MFFSISALFEKTQSARLKAQPKTQSKVHDYTRQQQGRDYCFGHAPNETSADNLFYLTGIGDGIQQNDCILLREDSGSTLYKVVEIDHYSNVKSLWIALLVRVDPV
jgi:hypothetical protein